MAIALRKAGKARKRNPAPGWTKSPILWIGGGAVVALVGYRIWASRSGSSGTSASAAAAEVQGAVAPHRGVF